MYERVEFHSGGSKIVGIIEYERKEVDMPAIVLCHGLTNSKSTCPLINEATESFKKLRCLTFRFDFFGSGDSDGTLREKLLSILVSNFDNGIDFLLSLDYVDPNKIGIWGRSLGGTVALISCNPNVSAYVLLSTPISLVRTFHPLYEKAKTMEFVPLPAKSVTGTVKGPLELNRKFFDELESIEKLLSRRLPHIRNVLVIQGDKDDRVSTNSAEELYRMIGEPKRLEIVEGADHKYAFGGEQAILLAAEWFRTVLVA